jgi:hypothetical protein
LTLALTSSRKLNMIFVRALSDAWLQDSKAVRAAATAASTSAVSASTTSCC